jgi:hypothetical protein
MAKYSFGFTVTGVDLDDETQERISRAVGLAGATALGESTPDSALSVQFRPGWWWRGIPPVEIERNLRDFALEESELDISK